MYIIHLPSFPPQLMCYVTLLQLYTSIAEEDHSFPTLRTKLKVPTCIHTLSVHYEVLLYTQEYYCS